VHEAVASHFAVTDEGHRDFSRGAAVMTMRNFNAAVAMINYGKLTARNACKIAYLSQLPVREQERYLQKLPVQEKETEQISNLRSEIATVAKQMGIYPHKQFLTAAMDAILAARSGLHVLLEGSSGSGLTTLARFVALFCLRSPPDANRSRMIDIPRVLLGPESTIDSIIGAFRPQPLANGETDKATDPTQLVQWENGPFLRAALLGVPVVLDRIESAKAQVTERINPILERNARSSARSFFVPEMGDSTERDVQSGFVVIATLTTDQHGPAHGVSPALRNRFVTIAVEAPQLDAEARESLSFIAMKMCDNIDPNLGNCPAWTKPAHPNDGVFRKLANLVSQHFQRSASDLDLTVRGVVLLSGSVCRLFGPLHCGPAAELIAACCISPQALESKFVESLVDRTLNDPVPQQRFFYKADKNASMWKTIAALTIASATGVPLFLQGVPGCGKTEAVRHFSSSRLFRARTPVYSVSCSEETSIEQFLGSHVFDKNGFRFVEGPLVQAAKEGCVFLADEFNLLPSKVMMSLIPFLEARPGDTFSHPDVRQAITIAYGFLFVGTGNDDLERGRVRVPDLVMRQLLRLEVSNPTNQQMEGLITEIIKVDYPRLKKPGPTPELIRRFIDEVDRILHVSWSLRVVRRLLRRLNDFIGCEHADKGLPSSISPISATVVALSFILCTERIDTDPLKEMIAQTADIFGGSQRDAENFAFSRTQYHRTQQSHYLIRGSIALPIDDEADFPAPMLDVLFWARWTGGPEDSIPRESLLIVGPTSYKGYALSRLLPQSTKVFHMTRETQISELIGSTILSQSGRLEQDTDYLVKSVQTALLEAKIIDKNETDRAFLIKRLGERIKRLKNQEKTMDRTVLSQLGVLRGSLYILLCLDKFSQIPTFGASGISMAMCFVLSIVTISAILGHPLVLRAIHLPPPSVLERLNSLLEDPRSLVLAEDTQNAFNNPDLISKVSESESRSLPIAAGFCIAATTNDGGLCRLSRPLQSRFTVIRAQPYEMSRPLPLFDGSPAPAEDLENIAKRITMNNTDLIRIINKIHSGLSGERIHLTIIEFIRWCHTTMALSKSGVDPMHSAGIAALRTIIDCLTERDRRRITKLFLAQYLPHRLVHLVVCEDDPAKSPIFECPVKLSGDGKMTSEISNISVCVSLDCSLAELRTAIHWTRSAIEMADAVFTSVASGAITIFEGSPGRGKTAVARALLVGMGFNCTRVNLSPTTSAEDLFGREIPQADSDGGIATKYVDGPLTNAMRLSHDLESSSRVPPQAILLDEVNLASIQLLELIEVFMLEMMCDGKYILPNGKEVSHGRIVIVATMNSAALSNARSMLSSKLQGASHFLRLPPFTNIELEGLAKRILTDEEGNQFLDIGKLMEAHRYARDLLDRESGAASERDAVTLREFLRLKKFHTECPLFHSDLLIELVYATQFSVQLAHDFRKHIGLKSRFEDTLPLVRDGKLVLTDTISIPLFNALKGKSGPAQLELTTEQRRVSGLIGAAIMAHRPVALFGESGSGKTHLIRSLAQVIGAPLGVVQFNPDTDSASMIGILELDGNPEDHERLCNRARDFVTKAIRHATVHSISLALSVFGHRPNFNKLRQSLNNLIANSRDPNPMDPVFSDPEFIQEAEFLADEIDRFLSSSIRNFVFKEGSLLRMMRYGGWILLDGVDPVPQEVERLMSLLEEEPSLAIYEGIRPLIFYGGTSKRPEVRLPGSFGPGSQIEAELIPISPDFQIFITCRDPRKLSPALRSRCFCAHLQTPSNVDQLSELARHVLSRSSSAFYRTPLSEVCSKVFSDAAHLHRKGRKLLFSRDSFSPHRVVNCARGISNDLLDSYSLASALRLSFVGCFKEASDQTGVVTGVVAVIDQLCQRHVPVDQSEWEAFVLQAGRLEYAAVYGGLGEGFSRDKAEELLGELFTQLHPCQARFRELPSPVLQHFPTLEVNVVQFETALFGWIETMTFGDIVRTVNVLDEVEHFMTRFHRLSNRDVARFFKIVLFTDILRMAIPLCEQKHAQGIVLCQKRLDPGTFVKLAPDGRDLVKWTWYTARIQHYHQNWKNAFRGFPIESFFSDLFSRICHLQSICFHVKPRLVLLLAIPWVRQMLSHFELKCANDDTIEIADRIVRSKTANVTVVSHALDIPHGSPDSDGIVVVVDDENDLQIRFESGESLSSCDAASHLQSSNASSSQPWGTAIISHDDSTKLDPPESLSPEEWIWLLAYYCDSVPSDLLTDNIYMKELIDSLRRLPEHAIATGSSPLSSSLTVLGPVLCQSALNTVRFIGRFEKASPDQVIETLGNEQKTAAQVVSVLDTLLMEIRTVIDFFGRFGLSLWATLLPRIQQWRSRSDEINEEQMLEAKLVSLLRQIRQACQDIKISFPEPTVSRLAVTTANFLEKKASKMMRDHDCLSRLLGFLAKFRIRLDYYRDVRPPSAYIPQLLAGSSGCDATSSALSWETGAVDALIQYTLAECLIDRAREHCTFENVVCAVAALNVPENDLLSLVSSCWHLFELGIAEGTLSQSHFEELQMLNRIYFYHAVMITPPQNPGKLRRLLHGFLTDYAPLAFSLQMADHKGLTHLQYPNFRPVDLVNCLWFSTESGHFPGPFAPPDLSDPNIAIPKTSDEAMAKIQVYLGKHAMIIAALQGIVAAFSHPFDIGCFALFTNARDLSVLKQNLSAHPGVGIVRHLFPAEFERAVTDQGLWKTRHQLSILLVLLHARAMREEESPDNGWSASLAGRWRLAILKLPRDKPRSYRIVNLLGHDIIDDTEARMSRLLVKHILDMPDPVAQFIARTHLDDALLQVMTEYGKHLVELEHVPLTKTPFGNLGFFFWELLRDHCNRELEKTCLSFRSSLVSLEDDILKWIRVPSPDKIIPFITARFDILKTQTATYEGAVELAKSIQNDPYVHKVHSAPTSYAAKFVAGVRQFVHHQPRVRPTFLSISGTGDIDHWLEGYFDGAPQQPVRSLITEAENLLIRMVTPELSNRNLTNVFQLARDQLSVLECPPVIHSPSDSDTTPCLTVDGVTATEARLLEWFGPLVAPVQSLQQSLPPVSSPIRVHKVEKTAVIAGFNILIGDHSTELTFIVSRVHADLGVHIYGSCPNRCGGMLLENLSTNSVHVKLVNPVEYQLKAVLKSDLVQAGSCIDISFDVNSDVLDDPVMAWCEYTLVAESSQGLSRSAQCSVQAQVRRVPLIAIIESPNSFLVQDHRYSLAPAGFQDEIKLVHHFPHAHFSKDSLGFSLRSSPGNKTNAPRVTVHDNHSMTLRFDAQIGGQCAGDLTVGLGHAQLYCLPIRVAVSNVQPVKLYHPASPGERAIKITGCTNTSIIVSSQRQRRRIHFSSNRQNDVINPPDFELDAGEFQSVNIQFLNDYGHRQLTVKSNSTSEVSLGLTVVSSEVRLISDSGKNCILLHIPQGAFLPAGLIHRDGSFHPTYLKAQDSFSSLDCPVIVLEHEVLYPPSPRVARPSVIQMTRWTLDKTNELRSIPAGTEFKGVILWAETSDGAFVRVIPADDSALMASSRNCIQANEPGCKVQDVTKYVVTAANGFLPKGAEMNSKMVTPTTLANGIERGGRHSAFSLVGSLLLTLSKETIEYTARRIALRVTGRVNWQSQPPAACYDPSHPDNVQPLLVIWYTVQLVNLLCNPRYLSPSELACYRTQLTTFARQKSEALGEPFLESFSLDSSTQSRCHEIGVISGRFVDAAVAREKLQTIKALPSPQFCVKNPAAGGSGGTAESQILDFVAQNLKKSLDGFGASPEPRNIFQGLLGASALSMQVVIGIQSAGTANVAPIIFHFTVLSMIVLELKNRKPGPLFPDLVNSASRSILNAWEELHRSGIEIPSFVDQLRQASGFESPHLGYITRTIIPDCDLRPGSWQNELTRASGSRFFGIEYARDVAARIEYPQESLPEQPSNDSATDPPTTPQRLTQEPRSLVNKFESPLTIRRLTHEEILNDVQGARVDDQPPAEDESASPDTFLHLPLDPDKVSMHHAQNVDFTALHGKSIEARFIRDWIDTQRAPKGKNGQKKLSEPRIMPLLNGTKDIPCANAAIPQELAMLQPMAIHLQALLYSELAMCIQPYSGTTPVPKSVRTTEVALLIDISSSMTTLSQEKCMAAQVFAVALAQICDCFGIPMQAFAFADREAIWKLTDPDSGETTPAVLRIIDALRAGNRPGSYPLDALVSVYDEWHTRHCKPGALQGAVNHLSIVISDFISPQTFDRDRDWSTHTIGPCVLISLQSTFQSQHRLSAKNIPPELYENGIVPVTSSSTQIEKIAIHPEDILPWKSTAVQDTFLRVVTRAVACGVMNSGRGAAEPRSIVLLPVGSPVESDGEVKLAWSSARIGELRDATGDRSDFFFQVETVDKFALMALSSSSIISTTVDVPDATQLPGAWLEQKSIAITCPFGGISQAIATTAFTPSLKPNVASGKEPSASSGELWIDGLRRFISSGFTYPYIFRKRARRNQKVYSVTIVIDSVQRLFMAMNASHTIPTLASLLGAFPLIPDSDDISVDVLSVCDETATLVIESVSVRNLSEGGLINDIILTARASAGLESGIGVGLQAALELESRRSGGASARRIIALTDGIVTVPDQVLLLKSALSKCEEGGIDVLGIGVGIAPVHLDALFPVALYCPNPSDLGRAMACALGVSGGVTSNPIVPLPVIGLFEDLAQNAAKELCGLPRLCPSLASAIQDQCFSQDFFERIGSPDHLFVKGSVVGLTQNPEDEPYHDDIFSDFQILIVCLYMGANEANNRITKKIFDEQCGAILHRKGFLYTFVCSYGEALVELRKVENGHCPYTQLWLFSSEGYGDLPDEARDKRKDLIIPALTAIADFWRQGGGLLLFCDNEPYNFEVNHLLETLSFADGSSQRSTKVRMGGDYAGRGKIRVAPSVTPTRGGFNPTSVLPSPGSANLRISLRAGLFEIYEGDTISYAVDRQGTPLTNPSDLWPFTAFAWSTEEVEPPRPFILFYDPVVPANAKLSPGPIVLHGGFTSAFYEFGADRLGTGRLIVSIACWLVRVEERLARSVQESIEYVTWTEPLPGDYRLRGVFKGWRQVPIQKRHSILVLDGSGSMYNVYADLIIAANEYIRIQTQPQMGGLISVVSFGSNATILFQMATRLLGKTEGFNNGSTNFTAALDAVTPLIQLTPPGFECRIIFFTDGCPDKGTMPSRQLEYIRSLGIRLDPIGFGEAKMDVLKQLACCGGEVTMGRTMADVKAAFIRKAATSQPRH
jgi:MoxR-like ATPase